MREPHCPVCGGGDITLYMKGVFDCESTSVMECNGCGLQFLDPMMSDEEEHEYYRNYYENQKTRHYKTLSVKDIQTGALKNYDRYKDIYLDLIKDKKDILEIGSGSGGFLRFVKGNSPKSSVVSIEKSESNRDFLKDGDFNGITFLNDLSQLGQESRFDLIAAFGVFEHIKNGVSFLEMVRRCLKDENSRLAMNIPNKRNPLVDLYHIDEFRKFSYMKQHYYTYTERSLEILAARTGYVIDKFNYIQVWGLDNHLSWLKNKRPQNFKIYTDIFSAETLKSYDNDLIKRKMTDLMMVVLKKS